MKPDLYNFEKSSDNDVRIWLDTAYENAVRTQCECQTCVFIIRMKHMQDKRKLKLTNWKFPEKHEVFFILKDRRDRLKPDVPEELDVLLRVTNKGWQFYFGDAKEAKHNRQDIFCLDIQDTLVGDMTDDDLEVMACFILNELHDMSLEGGGDR